MPAFCIPAMHNPDSEHSRFSQSRVAPFIGWTMRGLRGSEDIRSAAAVLA